MVWLVHMEILTKNITIATSEYRKASVWQKPHERNHRMHFSGPTSNFPVSFEFYKLPWNSVESYKISWLNL